MVTLFFLTTVKLRVTAVQNLIHGLHPRSTIELVQRTIAFLVLNEIVCMVENNSIFAIFFSVVMNSRSSCIICMYTLNSTL